MNVPTSLRIATLAQRLCDEGVEEETVWGFAGVRHSYLSSCVLLLYPFVSRSVLYMEADATRHVK